MENLIYSIDFFLLELIALTKNAFFDFIMPRLTVLGNGGIIWITVAIFMVLFKKTRLCGLTIATALILVLIWGNLILKPLIERPRPFMLDNSIALLIPPPTDFSFPSGHTYSSVASAIILWRFDKRAGTLAWVLATLIIFSRLYLMVHFVTDIIGGIVLGTLVAYTSIYLVDKRKFL